MVTKEVYYIDFDVNEVTSKINGLMSRWSVHMIKIRGQNWQIYNHSDEVIYEFHFFIDFKNIEGRIKLEDLKLNVIHHIESLRDDTTYIDELVIAELLY
ncbi:MAG: hypothetical protein IJQ68_03270 [Methanobrevibacter sp.]|uniref:hypothetical protein n=1 Tax=Methanobrevibacter sp. TaxID=66852 RepID=UPI0025EC3228|nr:hypothetical protein [Methanobrevibacter sp.]MBR0270996.1 hypothetical protein [Methanobrevibacter sp.]